MNGSPVLAEAIPAVTRPVKMPRVVPGWGRFIAGVVTGAVFLAVDVAGMVIYFVVVA